MSKMAKIDSRILKTKKAIRNAFAELLSFKEINQITVKDIADRADINRKTFYSYYGGVYAVVDEIENEIVTAFAAALCNMDFKQEMQNPYDIFMQLTAIFNSDLDFYGHLMRTECNSNLIYKIVSTLKQHIKGAFAKQISLEERTLEWSLDFMLSGMLTVYQKWFNSERSESIEELSRKVSVLVFSGMSGIMNEENSN